MDAEFLRTGGSLPSERAFDLIRSTDPSPVGQMRKVPLLRWHQIDQMVTSKEPPFHAEAMLETDVPGKRTFAVRVKDNSMQPLFIEGDIIFVNPDLPSEPGHYVVVESEDGRPEGALLRQLKESVGNPFFIRSIGGMKTFP
jgi:SOS-response transcriptional repressor LexA